MHIFRRLKESGRENYNFLRRILRVFDSAERLAIGANLIGRLVLVLLDLVGIFLVGVVVSLISGIEISQSSPLFPVIKTINSFGIGNTYAVLLFVALSFFILKGLLSIILIRAMANNVGKMEWSKARILLSRFLDKPIEEVESFSRQELGFGLTSAISSAITQAVLVLSTIFSEATLLLAISLYLLYLSPLLFFSVLTFFTLVVVTMNFLVTKASVRTSLEIHEANLMLSGLVFDIFDNFRQLSLSTNRATWKNKFTLYRKAAAMGMAKYQSITALPRYVTEIAIIVGVGILLIQRIFPESGGVSASVLAIFLAGIFRAISSLLPLQTAVNSWNRLKFETDLAWKLGLGEPLFENIEKDALDVTSSTQTVKTPSTQPVRVVVQNLTYKYPFATNEVFPPLSFEVAPGEFVAIVGKSGAGKSTLADLVLGLREPCSGKVSLGGRKPKDFIKKHPGAVAYVPQIPKLFHADLRGNLTSDLESRSAISDEKLLATLYTLGLGPLYESMPDGLETILGPDGVTMSGGQVQRIAIARAMLQNPKLLILDEPTSALDRKSEMQITNLLKELEGKVTVIMIAHREGALAASGRKITLNSN